MEKEDEIKPMIIENSVETDIKKEEYESNPWLVDSVSELMKYCCPECNYSEKDLKLFSSHAQENHERSSSLINDVNKMVPKNKHDMVKEEIKEEVFEDYENSKNYDVFNADSKPDFAIGKTDFKKKGNKRKIKSIKQLPSYDDSDSKGIFIDWQNDFSVRFSMFRKYLFRENYFKSYPAVLTH
jgi:hypothetical protein